MKQQNRLLNENLHLLIDNHPEPMAISDLNGKILVINEKLAKIFGKSKEELIGTLGYENVDTEAGKRRSKIIEKVIKTKKSQELIDKERNRWWKAIFQPIIDNEGNVVKIAYYIQDITEEKKDKNFIKYLSDQNLMGIIIIKGDKIIYINDAASLITGYNKNDFLNKGVELITNIIHPEDREFALNQLRKKLAGDKNVINRYKFRLISKNGNIKWLELYSKTKTNL